MDLRTLFLYAWAETQVRIKERSGKMSIGGIIVVFMSVLIGAVLAGPFLSTLINGVNETGASLENYTGGALAIGQQIPLFYVLLLVAVIVAPVAREFSALD